MKSYKLIVAVCLLLSNCLGLDTSQAKRIRPKDLLIVTVATNTQHDGYLQFAESCRYHRLELLTVGEGKDWTGGDIEMFPGGGQKVNLLKAALEKFKNRDDLVLLVTDSYDAILHGDADTILNRFMEIEANVVFSAEVFIWPDETLAVKYPTVGASESPYLNSGGYMGYASDIYRLLTDHEILDSDDDQLYFTNLFLDEYQSQLHGGDAAMYKAGNTEESVRPVEAAQKSLIKLDTKSMIFQTLNGVLDLVEVKYKASKSFLYNQLTGSSPLVIHGNGPIKHKFNRLVSYLNDAWTPSNGCTYCEKHKLNVGDMKELPSICASIMVLETTPFLPHFLDRISKLSYPKDKLDVILYNRHGYHTEDIAAFVAANKDLYKSLEMVGPEAGLNQAEAKNQALAKCMEMGRDYYLTIDSMAQLTNVDSIQALLEANRGIITPVIARPYTFFASFWGEVSSTHYYARSADYKKIVERKYKGIWNVPYTTALHLIKSSKLSLLPKDPYTAGELFAAQDYDVAFAYNARRKGLFQHVDNQVLYGHLLNPDGYDTSRAAPDLHELQTNRPDWEMKYLHEDFYSKSVNETHELEEPCTDVYWFPVVSDKYCDNLILTMETFGKWSNGQNQDERLQPCTDVFWFPAVSEKYCDDLILTMETFGKWSNGQNQDTRLDGGYENVPTRDIHMNQVGLEEDWIHLLRQYVYPVQLKQYPGYYSELTAVMNFVVRYRPDEQPSLRAHHDASTFTVNMALNTPNVDYTGGGVKFLRYNCTLKDLRKGWMLMHPGRLTHYHEGLTTLSGTRYIMVSFINP